MVGYEAQSGFITSDDTLLFKASYSQTGADIGHGANFATVLNSTPFNNAGQSKLYTEAWWNYGVITQADTSAFNVTVEYGMKDLMDLGFYFTSADQSETAGNNDLTFEGTLTASHSYANFDMSLAYIAAKLTSVNNNHITHTAQAYLTYNFDITKK